MQALIMTVGVYFSWLVRKARSLWIPYASHMVLDIVGDSLIGQCTRASTSFLER